MLIVKEIIKQKGYTIEDVAKKMEIKRESLSRAINGNPTLDTLKKNSRRVGCFGSGIVCAAKRE